MKTLDKIATGIGEQKTRRILHLILDLEFEVDRMSEGGAECYEHLLKELEVEPHKGDCW